MKFSAQEIHALPVGSQGNAKLHADATGRIHVVWEESTTAPAAGDTHGHGTAARGKSRIIQHAILQADGRVSQPRAVAPRSGALQTRPALVVTAAGRILVAWNELDDTGKRIVVSVVGKEAVGE